MFRTQLVGGRWQRESLVSSTAKQEVSPCRPTAAHRTVSSRRQAARLCPALRHRVVRTDRSTRRNSLTSRPRLCRTGSVSASLSCGATDSRRRWRRATISPSLVDAIEYDAGEGPRLDAIEHDDVTVANDLAKDDRWPKFVERALRETPVRSMFGARFFSAARSAAALNSPGQARTRSISSISASAAAPSGHRERLGSKHATQQRRRENLRDRARLQPGSSAWRWASSCPAGRRRWTEAFEALRKASQDSTRKLRDLAAEVAETGLLPERRERRV